MVDNIKQEPNIELGRKCLERLDALGFKPKACFWFYLPDVQKWRYVVSSNEFDFKPGYTYYEKFVNRFSSVEEIQKIGLENITLVPTYDSLVRLLAGIFKTGPDAVGSIRFTSSSINGVFIDDAFIYRV